MIAGGASLAPNLWSLPAVATERRSAFSIFEVQVPKLWIGKSLAELGIRNKLHLNVLSIKRNEQPILEFPADFVFEEGDTVTVFGADKDLKKHLNLNY